MLTETNQFVRAPARVDVVIVTYNSVELISARERGTARMQSIPRMMTIGRDPLSGPYLARSPAGLRRRHRGKVIRNTADAEGHGRS